MNFFVINEIYFVWKDLIYLIYIKEQDLLKLFKSKLNFIHLLFTKLYKEIGVKNHVLFNSLKFISLYFGYFAIQKTDSISVNS